MSLGRAPQYAVEEPGTPPLRRASEITLLKHLAFAAAILGLTACAIPKPGSFYRNISAKGARPGAILRERPYAASPSDATAIQVIYASTGVSGHRVPVSGVIYIPHTKAPKGGRDIIAWAHPTTGAAAGCAPSLDAHNFAGLSLAGSIPGLQKFLHAGDIVAATDYQGLGVAGTHPYLIGKAEAADIIDSVRAARALPGADASRNYGVWGHSQGAQAALFAGQTAAAYAPDLHLVGVAAAAPPTALGPELQHPNSNSGRVLTAYVYATWSKLYHVSMTPPVAPQAVPLVEKAATKCINSVGQYLIAARAGAALKPVFLARNPLTTPPWPALFHENSPGYAPAGAPLLITQGTADTTVLPKYTNAFVRRACQLGDTVDYIKLKGVTHIFTGYRSAKLVAAWFALRFAGTPPPTTCPGWIEVKG
ncbi:alpha/beta hydrolase family protein [Acidiphilium acidophilum]|uniref:Alpha/beta fold hydrolase n=1 Tax=Acidiphilium acidophilum TaxID=76588 RepID=A0AAW9DTW3_ACIAO|nr:lipase family protein [Acidiphilium acidophilum]MDX5932145.1 alpha/beta fold hydrolase [Acidiphilium acidophilum]